MIDERTDEEKARSKRVHAMVMIILGVIMSVCALCAGLIAMHPGVFPSLLTGGWGRREIPAYRASRESLVAFGGFYPGALSLAKSQHKLVLLHLAPSWSREARLMEEQTYADPDTAKWIKEKFVPTKADPDERPDLAYLYGIGAWPTTALVAADGRLLSGAPRLTPKLLRPWADLILDTLRDTPEKADGFAADSRKRMEAVRRRAETLPGADDPVWGGAFHSESEFAKTLADQTAVIASTDAARAKAVLAFVETFMALRDGGYANAIQGELRLADGRIEEGSAYFKNDDAGRRADGLPDADRRVFAGPCADMARAVLRSRASSPSQKDHARRTLDFLWTRYVKDGHVLRASDGVADWPADQWSIIEALLAAGRVDRARKVFAVQDTKELHALGPNPYVDALRARLKKGK